MLRIASLTRINGAACGHLSLVVEERAGTTGPADRSLTIAVAEDDIDRDDSIATLAALVRTLPEKGELKGAYLFAWALYERQVKGTPMNLIIGQWLG